MSRYRLKDRTFDVRDPDAGNILAYAHQAHVRPACLCTTPPVPMYVTRIGDHRFILKRMPGTGAKHRPTCDHYEAPPELSGMGEVAGAAIQENTEDGTTTLRLDFALTKSPGRAAPVLSGAEQDTVGTDGRKLTLRGTLHYLWQLAGFNRWTPRMRGKRSWSVIRRHLLAVAGGLSTKGHSLQDALFIPEVFSADDKHAIAERRGLQLAPLAVTTKGSRPLALMVGEFKKLDGDRLTIKHLPDLPFVLNPDMRKGIEKHFAEALQLREVAPDSHLIVAATFGFTPTGVATVEKLTVMNVNEHWLPFEDAYDLQLVDELVAEERAFIKGLRFNLPRARPLAAAVLNDTEPAPVALYIIPPNATDEQMDALRQLHADSQYPSWFWQAAIGAASAIPALPDREDFAGMEPPAPSAPIAAAAGSNAGDAGDDHHGTVAA